MRDHPPTPAAHPPPRWTAWLMAGLFAGTLLAGLAGAVVGRLQGHPQSGGVAAARAGSVLTRLAVAAPRWEDDFATRSWLTGRIRPRVQAWLAGALRQGTRQVVVGRDGWLFFRPAVEHLTGLPFLDPATLATPDVTGRHRDPRPAILELAAALRARDVTLVVMPVPVKAALEGEHLSPRLTGADPPLANPSLARLVAELAAAGVAVFDPTATLADLKRRTGKPAFLATDTHWRPEAMAVVAGELARVVRSRVVLPEAGDPGLTTEKAEVRGRGDLAAMLGLSPSGSAFPLETVTIEKVVDADDRLWRVDPGADVLLLGDSFANIYSQPGLGWGQAAGLAEHLSLALQRPVDAILRNDSGAWSSRALLARELASGRDRLAGKRVVIWELAARELSLGDWWPVQLELRAPARQEFFVPPRAASVDVQGVITAMGVVPQPRSAPYADYIVALRVADLESSDPRARGGEAVVFVLAMRDYTMTPAADWRVGQNVRLRLRPWADVAGEYGFFTRGELDDEALMLVEPCWGEEIAE